jgi:hypothetical protein
MSRPSSRRTLPGWAFAPLPGPSLLSWGHVLPAAALLLAGCSPGTPTRDPGPKAEEVEAACALVPGCQEPRVTSPPARESVWRVELIRTASGGVRMGRVERLEVVEGTGVPLGATAGSHLLLGLDGEGEPVDGQFVRFPRFLRVEGEDWAGPDSVSLAGREVRVVGYVRALPSIRRLAVLDEGGGEVASGAPPRAGREAASGSGGRPTGEVLQAGLGIFPLPRPEGAFAGLAPSLGAQESSPPFTPPPHCAHVMLLEGEADRDWAEGMAYEDEVALVVPGPTQRAVLQGALGLMSPLLCHGISRVAFGIVESRPGLRGAVNTAGAGDMFILQASAVYGEEALAASEERRLNLMRTVIHEAAHATETLLNAEGARPGRFAGEWVPPSRALAAETLDRVRVRKSLQAEWKRVHLSFQQQGWASPYPGGEEEKESLKERPSREVARSGFMSRYGGVSYAEDIAEIVSWAYMAPHFRAAGIPDGIRQTEDFGCQEMRTHGERNLPSRFAAIYTKLLFLQDLGMVMPEDVALCKGAVGLPLEAQGFDVWEGGEHRMSFDRNVEARIGNTRGRYVYEMKAEGRVSYRNETHPSTARLLLDLDPTSTPLEEVAWPRGVYPLGVLGHNGFQLRLDGAAAGNFDVHDGFALVAEASSQRIAGSVFIRIGFRLSAPMPVPQTFDPPLAVRFLMEK